MIRRRHILGLGLVALAAIMIGAACGGDGDGDKVVDTTPPVISLVGADPVAVEGGGAYVDAGATATDDVDGVVTRSIATVNPVDTGVVGSYTVTYSVSDAAGNAAVEVTRTVNVVDTTPPVITRVGADPVAVEVGGAYADAGATATDNVDGIITGSIVTVNPVNTGVIGSYTVTYNVSDAAGNAAVEVTRTVSASFAGQKLTMITHDSFNISAAVIEAFEQTYDVSVTILRSGDAVEALNRAILTKGNPLGDLLFGVDNVNYVRALREDLFQPYASPELAQVDPRWIFDDSGRITPIDYGYVLFNYEKAALATAGLEPPTRLEDLTRPEWKGRVAVQDPNTSSPGQQFMLVTIAYFGEESAYTWLDFWRDLRANDLIITAGWEDAYFSRFSQYGGEAWLVMSYATSPPAEVVFAEEPLDVPPTANLIIPGASYLQIEGVGILQGAKHPALAQRFIDYMLSQAFQEDIPLNMFVYPVRTDAALPEVFALADIPESPAAIDADAIEQNLERWLDAWTAVATR